MTTTTEEMNRMVKVALEEVRPMLARLEVPRPTVLRALLFVLGYEHEMAGSGLTLRGAAECFDLGRALAEELKKEAVQAPSAGTPCKTHGEVNCNVCH